MAFQKVFISCRCIIRFTSIRTACSSDSASGDKKSGGGQRW